MAGPAAGVPAEHGARPRVPESRRSGRGAVLTDGSGDITGEGRNRAYDPPGGTDPLQGTPLAHAEMNVLAGVPIRWDLGACTLWSTQRPCSMCAAALSFTGVGTVRFLAPDPWAIATRERRAGREVPGTGAPGDDLWVVAANTLFLLSIVIRSGPAHKTFVRNEELEPETAAVVAHLVAEGRTGAVLAGDRPLTETLATAWEAIASAAAARAARRDAS